MTEKYKIVIDTDNNRVFDYKKINFKLIGLSLFTGAGFYNVNAAPTKLFSLTNNNVASSVHTVLYIAKKFDSELLAIENTRRINNSKLLARLEEDRRYFTILTNNNDSHLSSALSIEDRTSSLNLTISEKNDNSAENHRTKVIRTVFLYSILLLLVPFGIFYPFFLFYKRLLNKDDETARAVELDDIPELRPLTSFSPDSNKQEPLGDVRRAVVSQIQIAFAVKDNSLRQKLVELCSSVDSRTDRGTMELMRKTTSFLIELNECTHVSCSSVLFPIDRTKTEFEAICIKEQNKFANENLSEVGEKEKAANLSSEAIKRGSAVYVVVTLALCTSHSQPLFQEIYTKNQLQAALSKLSKMHQDELIKFDLLWNPQSENRYHRYLSNNELLINYIDMIRLF